MFYTVCDSISIIASILTKPRTKHLRMEVLLFKLFVM